MAAADCAGNGKYESLGESGTGAAVTDVFCLLPPATPTLLPCFLLQCNNPKTKEPKLTAAARIVPEWVEYDNEIKELLRRRQREDAAETPGETPSSSSSPPPPHKTGSHTQKTHTSDTYTHTEWVFSPFSQASTVCADRLS